MIGRRRTIQMGGLATLLAACCALAHGATAASPRDFWFGADLSYVNELEDCGGKLREHGRVRDPFALFRDHGLNLVRVRLWNDARWTHYSNVADVEKTLRRARAAGLRTLLDFHYSDDWADGDKQLIPAAWARIDNTPALAEALYRYTSDTLAALDRDGLFPDAVQVGNEINPELLGRAEWGKLKRPIDWPRNAALLNAGIRAVRAAADRAGKPVSIMLHIAQPENAEPWFEAAERAGVTGYDLIGLSYYTKWSTRSVAELGETIARLRHKYPARDVVLVETAYPWTLESADAMVNSLGEDAVDPRYPLSPANQLRYLTDLTQTVIDAGGLGVVYWEPAWISTRCRTRWGQGSGWENATFFDFHHRNEVLPGIDFMRYPYRWPPSPPTHP